jgi:hypothetical protein
MTRLTVGDRVQVYLTCGYWKQENWFPGEIVKIEPYTKYRRFYWVNLDHPVESHDGSLTDMIAVLNLKNIRKT